MGAGVDPHLYKASPGDVAKLQGADLVLYNGLHLEGKLGEIFQQLAARRVVRPVGDALPPERLMRKDDESNAPDPHVWFDVSLWALTPEIVAKALAEADPGGREEFERNARAYREELEALHADVVREIGQIPVAQRVLVTAHDAFRYFGRAYGIEVLGVQGISTESEAGLAEINRLVETLVRRRVKAVFVETSVSDKNVRALIEGAQQRGASVRLGGSLFSDAMGAPGTPEGSYPGMVRSNVKTIVEALK